MHNEAKRDCKETLNSQLKDKSEDGGKEKIEKLVQDIIDWFDKNLKRRSTATRVRRTRRRSRPRAVWRPTVSPRKTPTQRKSSRTSLHEDKVEMQDITSKFKVVNHVDKKIWNGTQISSRQVHRTMHALRIDSEAHQHDLTSRGGVLEERVYARCPQHMSTTTNEAQPQKVGALLPMLSCLGTPVGPGNDTHGTLGPRKRGGRGWPTPTPRRRSTVSMTHAPDSAHHKSSDKHGSGAVSTTDQLVEKTVEGPKEKDVCKVA